MAFPPPRFPRAETIPAITCAGTVEGLWPPRSGATRGCSSVNHGWAYRLDGCLRGVPRFDRTELFDKEDYGLIPVTVATWQGLLFVNLAA
jgi:hypothetical protein